MTIEEFAKDCERVSGVTAEEILAGCADDVEQVIYMGIEDNFDAEASADGVGWPPRKRKGDGHPLLNESGALRAAATEKGATGNVSRINGDTLTVGVDALAGGPGGVPGARVHQYGYPEKNIPARPYLEVNDDVADMAAERTADEIMKVIG